MKPLRELRKGDKVRPVIMLAFAKQQFTLDLRMNATEGSIGGKWIICEVLQCPNDCATRYVIREIPDDKHALERAAVVYREDLRAFPRKRGKRK